MQEIDKIDSIIDSINNKEQKIESIAKELRSTYPDLFKKITNSKLDQIQIAGIDGGLIRKEYLGASIIIYRAIGTIFSYEDGKLENTIYLPNSTIEPRYKISEPFEDPNDLDKLAGITRMKEEIKRATECASEKPDLVILDGAIIPHPSLEPKSSSILKYEYKDLIDSINKLIQVCKDMNVLLAGVIEDSRSNSFVKQLNIKESLSDIQLTSYLLKKNESTLLYQTELPKKFNKLKENIFNIFIRPTEYDRPIRIQFLSTDDPEKTSRTIASLINPISGHHCEYAAPTVLIEADQRAKLSSKELEFIESEIRTKLGNKPTLLDLRRNTRPF